MKYIELKQGKMQELVRLSGANRVSVWRALHYKSDSPLSQQIREHALSDAIGGREVEIREVEKGFVPNCNVSFERDPNGAIERTVHLFARGVVVVTDMRENRAAIFRGADLVDRRPCDSTRTQLEVLFDAQQMSDMLSEEA